ncbi:MAG TPA: hypothetical protein VFG46_03220 [Chryseolinea sp.]|nr:hypothetical protein [Chryseolinea sp.]
MNNIRISEEQILKIALRKSFRRSLREIKSEFREELAKQLSNKYQNELLTTDELCTELKLRAVLFIKLSMRRKRSTNPTMRSRFQFQTGEH